MIFKRQRDTNIFYRILTFREIHNNYFHALQTRYDLLILDIGVL